MNWLRKLFTENIGWKLLSLTLATGLWAAIGSDPITEATFRVSLEFMNVPANMEVLTGQTSVQLWARGPSHAVRQATPGDFAVRVDLRPLAAGGERTISLNPGSVAAPSPLQVMELIPSEVRITLDKTLTREVPIDPKFVGEPAPRYRVKEFHLQPPGAQVAGPGSHVSLIMAASTESIDLSHLNASETFVTSVSIPDPLVRLVRPKTVEVTVEIESAGKPGERLPAKRPH